MVLYVFGKRLESLREERGRSMADVARKLDLPYTTYRGYEKAEREAGHDFVVKVAKLYEVTADYLLGMGEEGGSYGHYYLDLKIRVSTVRFRLWAPSQNPCHICVARFLSNKKSPPAEARGHEKSQAR